MADVESRIVSGVSAGLGRTWTLEANAGGWQVAGDGGARGRA